MSKIYNILITGSKGQLGSEISVLKNNYPNYNLILTDIEELDITNAKDIDNFFEENEVDIIINCAAYTAVDKAESNKEKAFLLNTSAIDILVDIALKKRISLIQISTDYVFDGNKCTPYNEEGLAIPVTVYGKTKNEGEKIILYSEINSAIIRTSWLYSVYGNNFVKTMIKLGNEKNKINVVFDQIGTPTNAADLAKVILDIAPQIHENKNNPKQEIYHYSNEGVASWYDFACEIFRNQEIECKIIPVNTTKFPTPAKRPAYSVMDKTKIKKHFNLTIPNWIDSLRLMLNNLNNKQ